ncbi:hypothetical protein [Actinophytocola sp.]|uniref:hypothetical protein n=1 Tax=Actinophytocola sp. TaxID=1872138 RepID=UPI002D806BF9|nr:hypothetical protein [Actinophytocola sp.]HET9138283.1 hypothetical protein [Actinophytocola sp.]
MKRTILALALAGAAALAVPAVASAEPLPTFDYADCPAVPDGADPAAWRCEVLVSHGTFAFGRIPALQIDDLRMTFAESPDAQVFGALRAKPVAVPGGLLGVPHPLDRLALQLEYAGFADFHSVGDRMGVQHLKLAVRGPLLPRGCTIGSDRDPIILRPVRTAGPEVLSQDPVVVRFAMRDNEFAVPRAHGCGALTGLVERRFGIPSPGGSNEFALTVYAARVPLAP